MVVVEDHRRVQEMLEATWVFWRPSYPDSPMDRQLIVKEAFPMRDAWLLLNREKSRFYTKENSLSLG